MELLKRLDLKDFVVFDIETAREVPEIQPGTPRFDAYKYTHCKDLKEGETPEDHYKQWSGLFPEFARVVCISVGRFFEGKIYVKTFGDMDERTTLEEFNEYLYKFTDDMSRLVGHAVIQFDIPFVAKRMLKYNIQPHPLLDVFGKKPWDVEKTVVDTKKLWQGPSFKPTSLVSLTQMFDIPSPKDDIDGSQVGEVFWTEAETGLARISAYCEKDVARTAQLLQALRGEKYWDYELISEQEMDTESTPLERIASGRPIRDEDLQAVKDFVASLDTLKEKLKAKSILMSLAHDPKSKLRMSDLEDVAIPNDLPI